MSLNVVEPDSHRVDFAPLDYLKTYFNTLDDEDAFTARFLIRTLSRLPDGLRILEVGGGPVLSSALIMAPHANDLDFADFLPDNLEEVRRWLTEDVAAFNWGQHTAFMLNLEGIQPTPEAVQARETTLRQAIKHLLHCDFRLPNPLPTEPANTQYDLVVALYCTEVPSTTLQGWQAIVRHVSSLVRQGGVLILGIITGSATYNIGDRVYQCVSLTSADLRDGLLQSEFLPESIELETLELSPINAIGGGRHYHGLAIASAIHS